MAHHPDLTLRRRSVTGALASTVFCTGLLLAGGQAPAAAAHQTVIALEGSAFGYFTNVSLFGAPPSTRGPAPTVTLPPNGSVVPITATVSTGDAVYGPARFFSSGPITVSTMGIMGDTGSVTSTADIDTVNRSGQEAFTATSVSATCTASLSGVTGSTTIVGGILQTSEGDPDVDGDETNIIVPPDPEVNTTYEGAIEAVGDTFRYVFNEQIMNPDGSITVNAAHQYALGPNAVGDLIVGQVVCGVTGGPSTHVNAPPVAEDDIFSTGVNVPLTVAVPGVLANDTDPDGDALTAGSATDPADGSVTLNPDGSFTYTPDAGFVGTDTFTYTATDPSGAGDTGTVTVTVTNHPPYAVDDAFTTDFNTPLTVTGPGVLGNDTDADGDALTAGSATDPARGSVTLNPDGSFTYTPDAGLAGNDTFTYTVTDPRGASDTATVTVAVAGVPGNQPPVAVSDNYRTLRDIPLTVPAPGVLGNDSDPDGDALTVVSYTQPPSGGSITMNADGSFTFTPATRMTGNTFVQYTVSDGRGGTAVGRISLSVDPDPTDCAEQRATLVGTDGNDTLVGTSRADVISGLGGNDTITGLGGDDLICGGAGDDFIDGRAGNDSIEGGDGNDHIVGGDGNDQMIGNAGDDYIRGGAGSDFMDGRDGNDDLGGGSGDDVILGAAGDDRASGAKGNDTIYGDTGNDRLTGGDDDDFVSGDDGFDTCDPREGPGTDEYSACEAGTGTTPPPVRPANDDFAAAEVITGPSGTVTGSNVNATEEPGEPDHASGTEGSTSIWYEWTAPADGEVTFNTCQSRNEAEPANGGWLDTLLAVYTGDSLDSLNEVAANDDDPLELCGGEREWPAGSRVTFLAEAGTVYHIAVDGFASHEVGDVVLEWVQTSP